MKTATDPRHRNRVRLVQHLYSSQFQHRPDTDTQIIWNCLPQIDPMITESAPEWPIDKLNPIDLAILRLAVYELTIDKKTPFKVIIDEAIEIAKEYGSTNSPAFVNGALGKLVKDQHLEENEK